MTLRKTRFFILASLTLFGLLVVVLAPFAGTTLISFGDIFSTKGSGYFIFWQMRVPRILVSFMAGAGLAVSGMTFQAMFRNPLATPFTLGIASGASLGAAIYIQVWAAVSAWLAGILYAWFGWQITFGGSSDAGVSVAAFAGAIISVLLVYGLTRIKSGFSSTTMLLAGVAVSFFFSSMILFMHYISDIHNSFRLLRWIMGGLEAYGYGQVLQMLPFVLGGSAIIFYLTRELNLITSGEDIATSRGVAVRRTKQTLFFATSLMVGGVVALCGPIGFVGMMSPHICRLIIGSDHRYLTPATIIFGGSFLTLCDLLARTVVAPTEVPVGVITALLGGPFFLWLLMSRSARAHM